MHVCFHRALLACAPFSRRSCTRVRQKGIIASILYRGEYYLMHVYVGMCVVVCVCMYVRMYACCRRAPRARALSTCFWCAVLPACVLPCSPAVHHCVDSYWSGYIVYYVLDTMYVYVCMYARMYAYCRRAPRARALSARYSCSHARPPFIKPRAPVCRCCCIHVCTPSKACVSTKCILLVLAYRCACMLDAGMYHVYVAVVLPLLVPSLSVDRARMLERRSSLHA